MSGDLHLADVLDDTEPGTILVDENSVLWFAAVTGGVHRYVREDAGAAGDILNAARFWTAHPRARVVWQPDESSRWRTDPSSDPVTDEETTAQPCTVCGAAAGAWCVTRGGRPAVCLHWRRRRDAKAARTALSATQTA